MRILFKIIAAPFVVVLSVLWAVLTFLFCIAAEFLKIACGIGVLVSIILFIMHNITGGIVFMILAFLISPLGLPLIAEWLIDRLSGINGALVNFIAT